MTDKFLCRIVRKNNVNDIYPLEEQMEEIGKAYKYHRWNLSVYDILYYKGDLTLSGDLPMDMEGQSGACPWYLEDPSFVKQLDIVQGGYLSNVGPEGTIARAGLQDGDILWSVNGVRLDSMDTLSDTLLGLSPDEPLVELEYVRDQEVHAAQAEPLAKEDNSGIAWIANIAYPQPGMLVRGLVVDGNLTVAGDIYNNLLDNGAFLFVTGDLSTNDIRVSSSDIVVRGTTTLHKSAPTTKRNKPKDLFAAVIANDSEAVRTLLKKKPNRKASDEDNRTALFYAVAYGHIEILDLLLADGWDINARDSYYQLPLGYAVDRGDIITVKALLERGAMPVWKKRSPADESETPLSAASENGELEIVKLLLQYQAPVDTIIDSIRCTALSMAVVRDHPDVVRVLLDAGASPNGINTKNSKKVDYLVYPLHWPRSVQVVDMLVEAGAEVNAFNDRRQTALMDAAEKQDDYAPEVVSALLKHGADPRHFDDKGLTPLSKAERADSVRLIAQAMKAGDAHAISPVKDPSICKAQQGYDDYWAKIAKNIDSESTLPQQQVKSDDELAISAMRMRAWECNKQNHLEALSALIEEFPEAVKLAGASNNEKKPDSIMATIIDNLIRGYSDNEYELIPYALRLKVIQQAVAAGFDVNAKESTWGGTALHSVGRNANGAIMESEYLEYVAAVVNMLLQAGADRKSTDKNGATPADLAASQTLRNIILTGQVDDSAENEEQFLTEQGEAIRLDELFSKHDESMRQQDFEGAETALGDIHEILTKLPESSFQRQWAYYYSNGSYLLYTLGRHSDAYEFCEESLVRLAAFTPWPYVSEDNIIRETHRRVLDMMAWLLVTNSSNDIEAIEQAIQYIDDCFEIQSPIEKNPFIYFWDTRLLAYACGYTLRPDDYKQPYEEVLKYFEERNAPSNLPDEFAYVYEHIEEIKKTGVLS